MFQQLSSLTISLSLRQESCAREHLINIFLTSSWHFIDLIKDPMLYYQKFIFCLNRGKLLNREVWHLNYFSGLERVYHIFFLHFHRLVSNIRFKFFEIELPIIPHNNTHILNHIDKKTATVNSRFLIMETLFQLFLFFAQVGPISGACLAV